MFLIVHFELIIGVFYVWYKYKLNTRLDMVLIYEKFQQILFQSYSNFNKFHVTIPAGFELI